MVVIEYMDKEMHKIVNRKGEEQDTLLNSALEDFRSGNIKMANDIIIMFIDSIPDNTDAAKDLTKRLDNIAIWKEDAEKILNDREEKADFLEKMDIQTARMQVIERYVIQRIKACRNVFWTYRLYEDTSVVDYEV